MKKLITNKDWDKSYKKKSSKISLNFNSISKYSFRNFDFSRTVEKYIKGKRDILEIGCAPGNILINISKKFNIRPFGIEYAKNGVKLTKNNFIKNNFNPQDVILGDFFSKTIQNKYKSKFDIVASFGFIEHFDNPKLAISNHLNLLKQNGTLIITIPNFYYWNKNLAAKKSLKKHNIKIMTLESLKKQMPKNLLIKKVAYFGGAFNFGLFNYENKIFKIIKIFLFFLQKIIAEPIFYLLNLLSINLNNKFLSPDIILIGVKK